MQELKINDFKLIWTFLNLSSQFNWEWLAGRVGWSLKDVKMIQGDSGNPSERLVFKRSNYITTSFITCWKESWHHPRTCQERHHPVNINLQSIYTLFTLMLSQRNSLSQWNSFQVSKVTLFRFHPQHTSFIVSSNLYFLISRMNQMNSYLQLLGSNSISQLQWRMTGIFLAPCSATHLKG